MVINDMIRDMSADLRINISHKILKDIANVMLSIKIFNPSITFYFIKNHSEKIIFKLLVDSSSICNIFFNTTKFCSMDIHNQIKIENLVFCIKDSKLFDSNGRIIRDDLLRDIKHLYQTTIRKAYESKTLTLLDSINFFKICKIKVMSHASKLYKIDDYMLRYETDNIFKNVDYLIEEDYINAKCGLFPTSHNEREVKKIKADIINNILGNTL